MSVEQLIPLKLAVSLATLGLLLWGWIAVGRGRPAASQRLRDGLLAFLGLLGLGCGFNLGLATPIPHWTDVYHYFVGAKYLPELGYERLYACTVVAEAEAEPERAEALGRRRMRDLRNNELTRARVALEDPGACKRHFSPERWRAFRHDALYFRDRIPDRTWRHAQTDHGYNGTPAWAILGRGLASRAPASERGLLRLALIDPLLLLAMWGFAVWAFGWRATCVAAVFWGTSQFARFSWVGGAFLRHDWLVCCVVGIGLLRLGRPCGAGAALAAATWLRLFPVLALLGLALHGGLDLWRRRSLRPSRVHLRVALGALAASALILPLSLVATGAQGWSDFAANGLVHSRTPSLNHLGLPFALAYDRSQRAGLVDMNAESPMRAWKRARREAFARRAPIFAALVAASLGLLHLRLRSCEPWVAALLGLGLCGVALQLSGYYFALLLVYGFLSEERPEIGAALCGLAAFSWLIVPPLRSFEEVYVAISVALVAFLLFAAWRAPAGRGGSRRGPEPETRRGTTSGDHGVAGAPTPAVEAEK